MYTILYENVFDVSKEPIEENYNRGNETDSEPNPPKDEDHEYEIINLRKVNVDAANEAGEKVINEDVDFSYVPTVASDYMPSCTSTEVDSLSELGILATFHLLI